MRILKKEFLTNFGLLSLLSLILLGVFYLTKFNANDDNISNRENYVVSLQNQGIDEELNSAINDLILLAVHTRLAINMNSNVFTNRKKLENLIQEFRAFSYGREDLFDQIRYIDENGDEIVRINLKDDSTEIVTNVNLQNKKDRYYFKDISELNLGDIYISPMDLNIEYGKIEQPIKPMIRLGTPIIDDNNNRKGIVIINYLANNIINEFIQYSELSFGQNFYLNKNGYWLKSNNPQDEWGFMYPERMDKSFGNKFPNEWEIILANNSGQFTTKNGLFTYSTVLPLIDDIISSSGSNKAYEASEELIISNDYIWKLVSFIPTEILQNMKLPIWKEFIILAFLINLLIAILSWIIAISKIKRKKAEEALKESNENLEKIVLERTKRLSIALDKATESDQLKSAFLACMSHELRTPLNAIIGFSDLIDKDLPIEEIIDYCKIINSSGAHLLTIIEDLFDITLIESGQTKINKKKENLHTILNTIHKIIKVEQQRINKENIALNLITSSKDSDIIINTDLSKLKQVLINLLKNALKYTNEGYINYGYSLNTNSESAELKFYVEDTGIGIHEEQQEIVFDIFRQVDDTKPKQHHGIGIGLSISKKLVSLLGGKIWLESKMGKGSTFYFTIPIGRVEIANKGIEQEEVIKSQLKTYQEKGTILIVEDDKSSFEFLNKVLKKLGYNIIWAKDGVESIEYCKKHTDIELVLMDINMPTMNGYVATKAIKLFRPDLPIIAQTAYAMLGDREKSIEVGCNDHISKPIDKNEIYSMLDKYLQK